MGATPKLEVVDACGAAIREWNQVVILEKAALGATSHCADERALAAVSLPDRSLDGGWHVAAGSFGQQGHAGTLDQRVPRLVEFVQQQCQRALEDGRYVAVRDAVSQQVLRFAQLLVRFTGDGELDFVSFRGKRRDRGDVLPRLVKGQRNLATCGDLNRVRFGGEV